MIQLAKSECCEADFLIRHVCIGLPNEKEISAKDQLAMLNLRDGWKKFVDNTKYWIRNKADKSRPKCSSHFCADGTAFNGVHCGVGECTNPLMKGS